MRELHQIDEQTEPYLDANDVGQSDKMAVLDETNKRLRSKMVQLIQALEAS